jgi:uncharacterized membrane protein YhhN
MPEISLALSLACALAYWARYAATDTESLPRSLVKTTTLLALLATALSLGQTPALILIGLGLGALGDLALSRRGEPAFLIGMAAFALGHLCYAAAFAQHAQSPGWAHILALAALLTLLLSTELWLAPRTGKLRWPVRGYTLVIGLMAASTILLAPAPYQTTIRLGAALFLLSDLLLALDLFVATQPQTRKRLALTLWPAYCLGQALILCGASRYWQALIP